MSKKALSKLIYFLIFIIIFGILLLNDNGLIKYFKLKKEIVELNSNIEETKKEISRLSEEIDSLQTSDAKIEKVAREKYRMKFKNEQPILIEEN